MMFLVWATSAVHSQRIIVNSQGARIVMYPDGSWRPVEPGDSVLVRQYLLRTDSPPDVTLENAKGKSRNKAEALEYLERQWNEFYSALRDEEKQVQDHFRTATNAQFKAGQQLSTAESNVKLIEADQLAQLRDNYASTIKDLKQAKSRQKFFKTILAKAHQVHENIGSLTESKLNSLKTRYQAYTIRYNVKRTLHQRPEAPPKNAVSKPPSERKPETKPVEAAPVKTAPKTEAPVTSPGLMPAHRISKPVVPKELECSFTNQTVDEATGRKKTELESGTIFTHTDPDLRPYFKDKDLITCTGRLSRIGPYIYLTVQFEIASSHSQNNFGSLQSGSLLRFKLLDGDFVSLYNLKTDRGRIDPYSGHTIFTGQYALGKDEIKKLEHAELDKMRVLWGTGYEDYEVYHVDFLRHQLDCLFRLHKS